eukprot:COSAG06_NODE_52599_length_304_cov_3.780488_1_plen_34_part_01
MIIAGVRKLAREPGAAQRVRVAGLHVKILALWDL